MSTPRRLLLAAAAAAAVSALVVTGAPASASDHPRTDTHAYVLEDNPCFTTPNAYSGEEAHVKPLFAAIYGVSSKTVKGVDALNGETAFRWVKVTKGEGCWQPAGWLSSPVDRDLLAVDEFTDFAIAAPPAEGLGIGAALSLADRTVNAAPALDSTTLGEVDEGQIVATRSGFVLEANRGLLGRVGFRPIEYNGQLGWILATSLSNVPKLAGDDLTTSITPTHEVIAWTLPGGGEQVATLAVGAPVAAGVSSAAGWLPVDVDGTVAWVNQIELTTEPTKEQTGDEETLEERIERLKEEGATKLDGIKAERAEDADPEDTDAAGWWDDLKARVSSDNPMAEALDRGRLLTAGLLAGFALILAAVALAGARKRDALAMLNPALPLASLAALPAAVLVAVWAGAVAPSAHFATWTWGGTAVVGVLIAAVTAMQVGRTTVRAAASHAKAESSRLLLVAGGLAAGAHWVVGLPLAAAVLIGLVAAGAYAGRSMGERECATPHTHEVDRIPETTEVTS